MNGEATVSTAPATAPAARWLAAAIGALTLMIGVGLVLVWRWGNHAGPPLPVLAELPEFALVDQTGARVTRADLQGQPWIADVVFTRCQTVCPSLTAKMARLGPQLPEGVRRVSISVDPARDTPAVLQAYARQHGAAGDWRFLTGDEAEIHRLVVGGMKLGLAATPADDPSYAREPITHSTKLVLVDAVGRVRGYYDAFDDGSVGTLLRDAERLTRGDAAAGS